MTQKKTPPKQFKVNYNKVADWLIGFCIFGILAIIWKEIM